MISTASCTLKNCLLLLVIGTFTLLLVSNHLLHDTNIVRNIRDFPKRISEDFQWQTSGSENELHSQQSAQSKAAVSSSPHNLLRSAETARHQVLNISDAKPSENSRDNQSNALQIRRIGADKSQSDYDEEIDITGQAQQQEYVEANLEQSESKDNDTENDYSQKATLHGGETDQYDVNTDTRNNQPYQLQGTNEKDKNNIHKEDTAQQHKPSTESEYSDSENQDVEYKNKHNIQPNAFDDIENTDTDDGWTADSRHEQPEQSNQEEDYTTDQETSLSENDGKTTDEFEQDNKQSRHTNKTQVVFVHRSDPRENELRKAERHQYIKDDSLYNTDYKKSKVYRYGNKAGIVVGSLFNDPIKRAANPSVGEPWPEPEVREDNRLVYKVDPKQLNFIAKEQESCDILRHAITRYQNEILQFWNYSEAYHPYGSKTYTKIDQHWIHKNLFNITINLKKVHCNGLYPHENMDESYILNMMQQAILTANTIWGILRGLETFYQLLYIPMNHDHTLHLRATSIKDKPAHSHRGILIDTARHYLSKAIILNNIDAMSQNKFNVLHWHIVDDQSFPFQSQRFPNLWKKGAYAPHLVYSHEDIKEIINYSRLRGIRVIPEFDTPGHTRGWLGQPGLLTQCQGNSQGMTGVFDITKDSTYHFLQEFYTEVRGAFVDNTTHLGGDEVSPTCWYLNETILQILKNYTHYELLNKYFSRFHDILHRIDPNWKTIVWQEVLDKYQVKLNTSKTIIEVWNNVNTIAVALSQGFDVIYSGCWYMDHVKGVGRDWAKYYDCQVKHYAKDGYYSRYPGRFIGGEACMWAEYVDDNNVMQILWPRAITTAEKLWSHVAWASSDPSVQNRFQEQACRMLRRGIKVAPQAGPGHCHGKMPFDDPTQHYQQQPRY